jgi:hypothetical protein
MADFETLSPAGDHGAARLAYHNIAPCLFSAAYAPLLRSRRSVRAIIGPRLVAAPG